MTYYLKYKPSNMSLVGTSMFNQGYICVMQKRKRLWDKKLAEFSIYTYEERAIEKAKAFLQMLENLNSETATNTQIDNILENMEKDAINNAPKRGIEF